MIVAVVAIGCATGLIKSWLNSRKSNAEVDSESFNRLARAFMEHKKEMQQRIQNLEAIIADEDRSTGVEEIEAPEREGSLSNDLKEKNKVRS